MRVCGFTQILKATSEKDSALGERCGSVANFVKGTIAKIANLPQSLQSNHSPTANLRIHFFIVIASECNERGDPFSKSGF